MLPEPQLGEIAQSRVGKGSQQGVLGLHLAEHAVTLGRGLLDREARHPRQGLDRCRRGAGFEQPDRKTAGAQPVAQFRRRRGAVQDRQTGAGQTGGPVLHHLRLQGRGRLQGAPQVVERRRRFVGPGRRSQPGDVDRSRRGGGEEHAVVEGFGIALEKQGIALGSRLLRQRHAQQAGGPGRHLPGNRLAAGLFPAQAEIGRHRLAGIRHPHPQRGHRRGRIGLGGSEAKAEIPGLRRFDTQQFHAHRLRPRDPAQGVELGALLKVGDDHQPLLPAGASGRAGEQAEGVHQAAAEIGGLPAGAQAFKLLEQAGAVPAVLIEAPERLQAGVEGGQGDPILRAGGLHLGTGPRHRLRHQVGAPHRGAAIDQDQHRLAGAGQRAGVALQPRACEHQGQQQQGQAAQQQQQPVLDPALAARLRRARLQEHQRAEFHPLLRWPSPQMHQDRREDRARTEQVEREEPGHGRLAVQPGKTGILAADAQDQGQRQAHAAPRPAVLATCSLDASRAVVGVHGSR